MDNTNTVILSAGAGIGCLWLLGVIASLAVPVLMVLALLRFLGWF